MKKVLVVAGTYYPDSMATIGITQRFAEALAQKDEYEVTAFAARSYSYAKPSYDEYHNKVKIIDRDDINKRNTLSLSIRDLCYRIFKRISKVTNGRTKLYKNLYYSMQEHDIADRITRLIQQDSYDELVTVALPFRIHTIGSIAKKHNPKIHWTAISFDPYAFDEVTNKDRKDECIREEQKTLKYCDKIMFLSQFKNDYVNSILSSKIVYFELPNIRPLEYNKDLPSVQYDDKRINCVFLGNLYLIQRHPQFLFELFHSFHNDSITLYIVGDLIDIPSDYIDTWKGKLGKRLVLAGRVPQEVAINSMFYADVLINVGHSTTNQCPSKILDYMSVGKPILSISKIDNCTSLPLLNQYSLALTLYEKDGIKSEIVDRCEQFMVSCKKEKLNCSFEVVSSLFSDFTMDEMIKRFEK
jgi:hypothetical protein